MSEPRPDLGTPPKLKKGGMRIVPLGGLGEVGRNMTVIEYGGRMLIVDCGVLFPNEHQPGVDLILPDFSYIEDRLGEIDALVLTHGHEDHIGAVPYLLRLRPDIKLVGSRLTLALVEAKLKEHRITPKTVLVAAEDVVDLGPFECEFVAVNHSIPDALAVAVSTDGGTIVHTGDIKLDQTPLDGRPTDLPHFAAIGDDGVDLLLLDSTNAEVPGHVKPERSIYPAFRQVFSEAKGRIVVSSFASHIHRVQMVLDVAHQHHRKVAFMGRSMVRNMTIAADLGYLKAPDGLIVDAKKLDDFPPEKQVLVCTGSQGEPMAALSRMANGDHKISVGHGDTVVLASSLIPGNETSVSRVIDGMLRRGCKVVHSRNAHVHVSGHGFAGELLTVLNIIRPKNVMPVHGERRHLMANADLAVATGVPRERVAMSGDGVVVDLVDGVAKVVGAVDCGYVYVDGSSVGEADEGLLKDRRILRDEGLVTIVCGVDTQHAAVTTGPEVLARGVAEGEDAFDTVIPKITEALREAMAKGVTDQQQLQQVVRRTVGGWVGGKLRRKPMIIPVVVTT